MAQTIPDFYTSSVWVSINKALSIPVGTSIRLQNKSQGNWAILYEGDTPPALGSRDGEVITELATMDGVKIVDEGSEEIWVLSWIDDRPAIFNIQRM